MVGMCMGEQGMLSRILGIRAGGAFTFGSAGQGKETAPGQPTYRELRDFYRIEQIESVTKVYGIAGDPVSHSMSPWVMNSAFRRENVNAVYLPLHAKTLERSALHGDRPAAGWDQRDHALQAGDGGASGQQRRADPADRSLQHHRARQGRKTVRIQHGRVRHCGRH